MVVARRQQGDLVPGSAADRFYLLKQPFQPNLYPVPANIVSKCKALEGFNCTTLNIHLPQQMCILLVTLTRSTSPLDHTFRPRQPFPPPTPGFNTIDYLFPEIINPLCKSNDCTTWCFDAFVFDCCTEHYEFLAEKLRREFTKKNKNPQSFHGVYSYFQVRRGNSYVDSSVPCEAAAKLRLSIHHRTVLVFDKLSDDMQFNQNLLQ